MTKSLFTGGCQCGAVRYSCTELRNAPICHCRMCQKAVGGFYGPLVTGLGLKWTRGKPKIFASSNFISRGFCGDCGTPLTYAVTRDKSFGVEMSIGSLDNPEIAAPLSQVNTNEKLAFVDHLHELPVRDLTTEEGMAELIALIKSNQHPDHDTKKWPENS